MSDSGAPVWRTGRALASAGLMAALVRVLATALVRALSTALVAALTACGPGGGSAPAAASGPASAASVAPGSAEALRQRADAVLAAHRQMVVLLTGERELSPAERRAVGAVGQMLFHQQLRDIEALLQAAGAAADAGAVPALEALLERIESAPDWFDADRLAFKEPLSRLAERLGQAQSLTVLKLVRRIHDDLAVLAEVEQAYDRELKDIFGRFAQRGIELKREKWADYLAKLGRLYSREQILKDHGTIIPYTLPIEPAASAAQAPGGASAVRGSRAPAVDPDGREVFGTSLPPKTVVLTFDDGPHPRFTDEILEILSRHGAPAIFFQLGRNLGAVDAAGQARPGAGAAVAKRVLAAGHVLANHSFSHGVLAKMGDDAVRAEAQHTESLLDASGRSPSALFRFPYGARNAGALQAVEALKLRSMMWNIDSMDWADPVPKSIAQRVLAEVGRQQRGVILFHDIQGRTVQALPLVLDQLAAEGYRFATWRDGRFEVAAPKAGREALPPPSSEALYRDSHALVIGIDRYGKWPALSHAVRDARAVHETLVQRFGFRPENVTALYDGEATRAAILKALNDRLADARRVRRDDRVMVFFAGHGATRRLASGREVGYIVPVDAAQGDLAADAISMPQLQEVAEAISAKHVLYVVDACYSGLGLTRGGAADGSARFLADNARRIGRQMMTAGGADQQVADDGPGGHSVFTWTLLQALGGKADLNGDGVITATELAAYVAPAVAGISHQTPAFGSLPGSAGGEFVFELPAEREGLSADTRQLDAPASLLARRMDEVQAAAQVQAAPRQGPKAPAGAGPASGAAGPGASAAVAPAGGALRVTVHGLDGAEVQLTTPAGAAPASPRAAAQRANDRGLVLYRERRYDEAEAAFTEALKLQPRFALAANNLGFIYWKRGKPAEAARWFAQAVEMDPTRGLAHLNLGDAHLAQGDEAAARQAYARFVALQPAHGRAAEVQAWLAKPGDTSLRPRLPATGS